MLRVPSSARCCSHAVRHAQECANRIATGLVFLGIITAATVVFFQRRRQQRHHHRQRGGDPSASGKGARAGDSSLRGGLCAGDDLATFSMEPASPAQQGCGPSSGSWSDLGTVATAGVTSKARAERAGEGEGGAGMQTDDDPSARTAASGPAGGGGGGVGGGGQSAPTSAATFGYSPQASRGKAASFVDTSVWRVDCWADAGTDSDTRDAPHADASQEPAQPLSPTPVPPRPAAWLPCRYATEPVTALTPCQPDINMAVRVEAYVPQQGSGSPYPRSESRGRARSAATSAALASAPGAAGTMFSKGPSLGFREPSLCSVAEAAAMGAVTDGCDALGGSIESQGPFAPSLVTTDAAPHSGVAAAGGREASAVVSMDAATAAACGSNASTAGARRSGFAARSWGPTSGATTVVGGGGGPLSYASSCENNRSQQRQQAQVAAGAPGSGASDTGAETGAGTGTGTGAGAASDAATAAGASSGPDPTVTLLPVLRGKGAYGEIERKWACGLWGLELVVKCGTEMESGRHPAGLSMGKALPCVPGGLRVCARVRLLWTS